MDLPGCSNIIKKTSMKDFHLVNFTSSREPFRGKDSKIYLEKNYRKFPNLRNGKIYLLLEISRIRRFGLVQKIFFCSRTKSGLPRHPSVIVPQEGAGGGQEAGEEELVNLVE